MNKDLKDFLDEIIAQGWTIEKGRKHMKARKPGCQLVALSLTPSSDRAIKNMRADIRRSEAKALAENIEKTSAPTAKRERTA